MKLVLLSDKFYVEYADCSEILRKRNRPYACLEVDVDGVRYAIPFRHHIKHKFAFFTYGECGLDYTKAVVIKDGSYLDAERPQVEQAEWNVIRRNENRIEYELRRFIGQYKRAMKHRGNPRSERLLRFCSLQYFEECI